MILLKHKLFYIPTCSNAVPFFLCVYVCWSDPLWSFVLLALPTLSPSMCFHVCCQASMDWKKWIWIKYSDFLPQPLLGEVKVPLLSGKSSGV